MRVRRGVWRRIALGLCGCVIAAAVGCAHAGHGSAERFAAVSQAAGLPTVDYDKPPTVIWVPPVDYPGYSQRPVEGSATLGILVGVDGTVKKTKFVAGKPVPVGWQFTPELAAGCSDCAFLTWNSILSTAQSNLSMAVCEAATIHGKAIESWAVVRLDIRVRTSRPPWVLGSCEWQQLPESAQ
jgi:hypothetical protein